MRARHRAPWLLLCALLVGVWVAAPTARAERVIEVGGPRLDGSERHPTLARPGAPPAVERRLVAAGGEPARFVASTPAPRAPAAATLLPRRPRSACAAAVATASAAARAPPRRAATGSLSST